MLAYTVPAEGSALIALGPFELTEPLAKGGMGRVWAGRHLASGEPVAVKLMTHKSASDPRFRAAFLNEVRSVAALNHRNIAAVYDHGVVSEAEARASHGRLPAGAPWLAMELVRGGTLHDYIGRLGWFEVRHVALALLDALAHAHARGVIHRDLKPANVLVQWEDGLPQVALTDFGLAQVVEDDAQDEEGHFYGGTPSYMAPEQFGGQWRDYGPWTDLYGLGCLLWAMIRGEPPFGAKASFEDKRRGHLREPPPPLVLPWPAPDGLEDWLRTLLHKDPARRFRRAADAMWALRQLDDLDEDSTLHFGDPFEVPSHVDTLVFEGDDGSEPAEATPVDHTTLSLAPGERGQVALTLASDHSAAPPTPPDWRGEAPARVPRVAGAGLGLFGLRTIPMVDREPERDRLWRALLEARASGQPRVVALTGPAGSGKSRLAEWLCVRAHEVGSATVLRADHSPTPGAEQGIGPMLRRFLRCYGLDPAQTAARVEAIFRAGGVQHPDEWAALTEVIQPGAGAARIRFRTAGERYITVRRLLAGLCTERPVVLWLDDVPWGADALGFCQFVLDRPGRRALPLVVVLTGSDEAFAERPDEAALLDGILAHPAAARIEVGPLPPDYGATLVEGLLGLGPELAHKVEARTAGNPQFAVQLVGDWVQRGLLAPGPEGFVLRPGARIELPADVRALWRSRVGRLLDPRPLPEQRAAELAAVLGSDVDPEEWRAACDRSTARGADAHPSAALVDALLDQRFARAGAEGAERGWSFAHAMLREALVERAREAGRFQEHHAACAMVIEDRYAQTGRRDWRLAERMGRHLLLSGQARRAERWLLEAAEARALCGDYAVADDLLDLRDEAMELAGLPPGDERWGEGWMARHQVQQGLGHYDRARRWLDRLEVGAAAHGWKGVGVRAMLLRARQHRTAGEHDRALEVAKRAVNLADRLAMHRVGADARHLVASILADQGDIASGERWARQALDAYQAIRYEVGVARVWQLLGHLAIEAGRHDDAARILGEAARRFEEAGDRWGMASALNSQGDIARFQGRLEAARELYRRARGLFRAIGSADWTFPELNLGLVHLALRDHAAAREIFEALLPAFVARGDRRVQTELLVGLAACAAAEQQWLMWDDHMAEAAAALEGSSAVGEDTARLLSLAGDAAVAHGEVGRALEAYRRAARQWRALGRGREADNLEEFIARLEG